ncbi:DNA polymerase III subunit gamma/tau [Myxococcus qinghaiensis]|uniref:DNA polymerase III subunit gamma/tau n=1 Tax=Myxococcus qinghaiensis TaxID=2906758 RepID=UPI0020A81A6B|nr:DNA polymerase III subunit gamma/tau [Myxococcus qinghaiensis]MCP3167544.1 DNA polymerase III subunit gamma/tau [Myxococcus qinghaiensis]
MDATPRFAEPAQGAPRDFGAARDAESAQGSPRDANTARDAESAQGSRAPFAQSASLDANTARYAESAQGPQGPGVQAAPRDFGTSRYDESDYVAEPPDDIELPQHSGGASDSGPSGAWSPPPTPTVAPPVAATGPVMAGLPPSAARPLSFLRNAPSGQASTEAPPRSGGFAVESPLPSGPVLDGLPPTAARPLSFLRQGSSAPPAPSAPVASPGPHAGATPLSRTTEAAPNVRVINVRKPEAPPAPPESVPVDDEDSRFYPEEASPGGCASGECIPEPELQAPAAEPEPEPAPMMAAAPAPAAARSRDNPNLPLIERWRAAVESVKASSLRHGTALANGRLVSMKAGEIILGFLPSAGLHRMTVTAAAGKAVIDKLLAEHFGRAVKLSFQDVSADDTRASFSIAERDAQSRATHEKNTESKVRNHAAVRAVLLRLGGEIEHIQIYEPERPSAASPADAPIEAPDESA